MKQGFTVIFFLLLSGCAYDNGPCKNNDGTGIQLSNIYSSSKGMTYITTISS